MQYLRRAVKHFLLGSSALSAQCTVGLADPQTEVSVWLHGCGTPVDVTSNHFIASVAPFTVGIYSEPSALRPASVHSRVVLRFCSLIVQNKVLGELGLRFSGSIPLSHGEVAMFQAVDAGNYCLPAVRLLGHELFSAYLKLTGRTDPEVTVSRVGARAVAVAFSCPRPVGLVSAVHQEKGNLFPMNLMGPLGTAYFGFALNSCRLAAPLVEQAGVLAIGNIKPEHFGVARQLGTNHRRITIDWNKLPFSTIPSPLLGLPVPGFSVRVREFAVVTSQALGSHTFFIARVLSDTGPHRDIQAFMIHGIYDVWRRRHKTTATPDSEDSPRGVPAGAKNNVSPVRGNQPGSIEAQQR